MNNRKGTPKVCPTCSSVYRPNYNDRFCSVECAFLDKFKKGDPDHCWEWQRAQSKGYGRFTFAAKQRHAHIFAYEMANGPKPDDRWVLHTCDNSMCVNPGHLYLGDHAQNTRDQIERGRQGRPRLGDAHHNAKLTTVSVLAIVAAIEAGRTQRSLADRYGVGQQTISAMLSGRTWSHVTGRGAR